MCARHFVAVACCVGGLLCSAAPASAAGCSAQDRLDGLTMFFDGWSRGDLTAMKLDRPDATAPFGLALPRRHPRWPHELQGPKTWRLASVRAWLRRRVAAGDRVTLLRVRVGPTDAGVTGGTLSYRRTAPDVRGGHKVYGLAKFEMHCGGLTALGGGRSWWTWTTPITLCHPGERIGPGQARACGNLP